MKKGIISMALAVSLLVSFSLTAFASDEAQSNMVRVGSSDALVKENVQEPRIESGSDDIDIQKIIVYPAYVQIGDTTGAVVYDQSVSALVTAPNRSPVLGLHPTATQKTRLYNATVAGYNRVGYITQVTFRITGNEGTMNRRLVTQIPANVGTEYYIDNGIYTFTGFNMGIDNMDFEYSGYFTHGNGKVNQAFGAYVTFPK